MSIAWDRLRQIIESHDRFLITSHVRPDGDSIGSELGMAAMLAQKGKQSEIVNASSLPARYGFLDPARRIRHHTPDLDPAVLNSAEVVIIVDTSAWQQLGSMAGVVRDTAAKKLIIDHHIGHDDMGAELFKDTDAPACGAILTEAVDHLGCELTPEIAEPLFVALATDTGWFRFSSTRGKAMRLAARLIDAGLRVDRLYRTVYEDGTLGRLKLLGRTLDTLKVTSNNRVAYTSIRLSDFEATGSIPQDSEDLINYTLAISGVSVGLMFVELRSGAVKVSLRSRNGLDCTRVAAQFGGGGHREAAGLTIECPLADAQSRVLSAVEAALDNC
jgi:phosphoesterase RecJ-like protein